MKMQTLQTPEEILAMSKAFAKKATDTARDTLTSGVYPIDFLVRVHGSLTVAEDTEKTPTVSIPVKEVLALFVARSGATRAASLALLERCLTDALNISTKGSGAIEELEVVDAAFEQATTALLSRLPKTPVRGAVKAALEISKIETPELALA